MKKYAFREGMRDAIPTVLGYASIGLCQYWSSLRSRIG